MLYKTDRFERTSLMICLQHDYNKEIFPAFWDFFQEFSRDEARKLHFLHRDKDNRTAFHYAALNGELVDFVLVREAYKETCGVVTIKNLILKENSKGENLLLSAVQYGDSNCFNHLWIYAQKLFRQ